jgi:hypothetical protein
MGQRGGGFLASKAKSLVPDGPRARANTKKNNEEKDTGSKWKR